jgi:two-component system sensor histidine kinase QseC
VTNSIRSRILLLVMSVLAVSLAALAVWSYRDAEHEIEEVFDAQLAQSARLLAGIASRDMAGDGHGPLQSALNRAATPADAPEEARRFAHEYEGKLGFVVFDAKGGVLLHSASVPLGEFREVRIERSREAGEHPAERPVSAAALLGVRAGYHEATILGQRWNVFLLDDPGSAHWILVGDRADVRDELAGHIAFRSMLPELLGLPVLALLVWLAVGWGLAPLQGMAHLLKSRDPGNLSPLVLEKLPDELEPAVASLNRLLMQVTDLLEREKRFLSYAAHELRTPLAVLRLQADNAVRAADPADREQALKQLDRSVARATRLVEQLLALARLEPGAESLNAVPLDLAAVVRNEIAEIGTMALDRGQDITLEVDEGQDFHLQADEPSLLILLQNLISNAVRHTPEGGQVRVWLHAAPDAVEMHVQDSGPGVPPELRAQVFERFFREGPGQGAGLGLSIVSRIVELHRGLVTLRDSPLGGLDVVVTLPRNPANSSASPR